MIDLFRTYAGQILLLILSLVSSFLGVNWSYRTVFPGDDRFLGLGAHGWILDGAVLTLPKLATVTHRVEFEINPGRPQELGPARIRPVVCGSQAEFVEVQHEQANFSITLPAGCHRLELRVENPFLPGRGDDRQLVIQAPRVLVSLSWGLPLLQLQYLLHWAVLIFVVSVLSNVVLRRSGLFLLMSYLIPPLCGILIARAGDYRWSLVEHLFLASVAVLLGVALGVRHRQPDRPDGESSAGEVAARDVAYLLVMVAIIAGGLLRFYHLDWGFPMVLHPDEARKVGNIGRMIQRNSLEPQNFLHPTLLLYLSLFVTKIFALLDIQSGSLRMILAGRFVSALAGTLSIPLLFVIGQRLVGRFPAALASLVLALLPLHVTCSRYMKEDALLVFCVLTFLVVFRRAIHSGSMRLLYLSGVLAGVACGAKYTGLVLIPVVLGLPFLRSKSLHPDRRFLLHLPTVILLIAVGFLITTPYALFSFDKFLEGVQTERMHLSAGHDVKIDAWSQFWMFHFVHSLLPGMTVPAAIISLVGLGMLLRRGTSDALLILLLVAAFYLPAEFANSKPAPQAERYILGALPFLCLAAAEFISVVFSQARGMLPLLLVAVLVVSPGYRSVALATELHPDTRWLMAEWIKGKLPPDTSFLIESRYAPKLRDTNLKRQYLNSKLYHKSLKVGALETSGFDYLLLTSLSYDRYFREPSASRLIRNRFLGVFTNLSLAKEFAPRHGSYGFHNPTVRLYALSPRAHSLEAKKGVRRGAAVTDHLAVE